jgi:hypothetical protein
VVTGDHVHALDHVRERSADLPKSLGRNGDENQVGFRDRLGKRAGRAERRW